MSTSEENEEEAPMSRSFSVEDLLDEVEKICYEASGVKVRDNSKTTSYYFIQILQTWRVDGFLYSIRNFYF